jgi:tRNA (guanine37-N1)-methyltransferase
MHFTLLTVFEDMFPGPLAHSIAGKALQSGLWGYEAVDIRQYALDKHKTVDDIPYGGGTGLVMRPDVLGTAIETNRVPGTKLIYMSPRGRVFNQAKARELIRYPHITILCGRYEGVDERVIEEYEIEEVSIGDYILSGGEMAALTVMDACIRLLPGVIGKQDALVEESFGENTEYAGLLEYPLYTRPLEWKSRIVPEVLLSGNHKRIAQWRLEQAKSLTKDRRPDLWCPDKK